MSSSMVPRTEAAPVIEPATEQWLDALAAASSGPPYWEGTPAAARPVLRDLQTSVSVDLEPADVEGRFIPGGPTGDVDLRIVRPQQRGGALPALVYTHGGGWILGDKDTHDRLVREIANAAGAVVVFVNYTPAPEAHYPVQNEQAYTALEWVAEHASEIGADPSRIAIMGDSVGGNMATAVAQMAKERGGPSLAAQVLFYPVTDADFQTPTYERYADGPWLTRCAMKWFWDAYAPDEERRLEPTASPLRADLEVLSRAAADAARQRRARRPRCRGPGVRPPTDAGRRPDDARPVLGHDPRLRAAQPDRRNPSGPRRDRPGRPVPAHGLRRLSTPPPTR